MLCPSCGHDNLEGLETCELCDDWLGRVDTDPEQALSEAIRNEPLSVLNPAPAVAVDPATTVAEAVRLLAERNIGCVLVTSGGKLLGIFSERDALLRIGARYHEVAGEPIEQFMTPAPQTLTLSDSIAFALNRMDVNDFRHIPIEADTGVAGIISVRDCLAYITQHFPELAAGAN